MGGWHPKRATGRSGRTLAEFFSLFLGRVGCRKGLVDSERGRVVARIVVPRLSGGHG